MTMAIEHMTRPDQPSRADQFKTGMRKLASGVTLITAAHGNERAGLIATAVSSVSTTPPTLLICVNRAASAHDVIDRAGSFAVNLLAADDLHLADIFGKSALRDQRFKVGDWSTLLSDAPVLDSALASFDCEIVQRMPYGSHTIFLGHVHDVRVDAANGDPLLYMDSAFRRLAGTA